MERRNGVTMTVVSHRIGMRAGPAFRKITPAGSLATYPAIFTKCPLIHIPTVTRRPIPIVKHHPVLTLLVPPAHRVRLAHRARPELARPVRRDHPVHPVPPGHLDPPVPRVVPSAPPDQRVPQDLPGQRERQVLLEYLDQMEHQVRRVPRVHKVPREYKVQQVQRVRQEVGCWNMLISTP